MARHMAEYESRAKVTVYPMGMSSEFTPITTEEKLAKAQKKRDEYNRVIKFQKMQERGDITTFDNSEKRNKTRSRSGHQNMKKNKDGTFSVTIGGFPLGTFDEQTAIKKRDDYRAANGMSEAEY